MKNKNGLYKLIIILSTFALLITIPVILEDGYISADSWFKIIVNPALILYAINNIKE